MGCAVSRHSAWHQLEENMLLQVVGILWDQERILPGGVWQPFSSRAGSSSQSASLAFGRGLLGSYPGIIFMIAFPEDCSP